MSGRILIVNDIPADRITLKSKLTDAYYDVLVADSGQEAIDIAQETQPDIVLMDVNLPDMNGCTACTLFKTNPQTSHIPVIILTDQEAIEDRILGVDVGADDFLTKPIDDLALFARLRNLMRMKIMFDELRLRNDTSRELGLEDFILGLDSAKEKPPRVMLMADDVAQGQIWLDLLAVNVQVEPHLVRDETRALELATTLEPDLYIIQSKQAECKEGLRLISKLRANPKTRQSAIVFVAQTDDVATASKALDLGATDYLSEPVDVNELVARVRSQIKRKRYIDRLRSNVLDGLKMAVIDPLTGLYNRRYAAQHIQSMIDRTVEGQGQDATGVAVMMLDLDNFKAVNDRHGHEIGDKVLQEFALRLQENVRGVDLVARLGGEEFCVAMPDTGIDVAAMAAERVRAAIEQTEFRLTGARFPIEITVSVGVAVGSQVGQTVDEALKRADLALYVSKHKGRNRVSFFKEAA